jgi:hypothetical protein
MTDDFLEEVAKDALEMPDETKLSRLTELARAQLAIEQEIEALEVRLLARKSALLKVSQYDIPELMHEVGAKKITLIDGREVSIKPFFTGKITDHRAYDWLNDEGYGNMVKVNLTISLRMADEERTQNIRKILHDNKIEWDENAGVHHSTLNAWVKDTITAGKTIDRDLFNVHTGWKTTIK